MDKITRQILEIAVENFIIYRDFYQNNFILKGGI